MIRKIASVGFNGKNMCGQRQSNLQENCIYFIWKHDDEQRYAERILKSALINEIKNFKVFWITSGLQNPIYFYSA